MSGQARLDTAGVHSAELARAYRRVLEGTRLATRLVELAGGQRVNVLEAGSGTTVVCVHGTNSPAAFLRPLLDSLSGCHVIAPDRPGQGLSDPADLPMRRYREAAVAWFDRLLDALDVTPAALVGHSMGGVWALWYALSRPERVRKLVLIGSPTLPGTRAPLPYRLLATPGIGDLLGRIPPTAASVRQFARFVGERAAIEQHPELIDLLVAAGRDPVAAKVDRREARVIISPLALLGGSGFRGAARVRQQELRRLSVPTLVVWGEHDPVGRVSAARAVTELIPGARLVTVPGGHAPWLGHAEPTAVPIAEFALEGERP